MQGSVIAVDSFGRKAMFDSGMCSSDWKLVGDTNNRLFEKVISTGAFVAVILNWSTDLEEGCNFWHISGYRTSHKGQFQNSYGLYASCMDVAAMPELLWQHEWLCLAKVGNTWEILCDFSKAHAVEWPEEDAHPSFFALPFMLDMHENSLPFPDDWIKEIYAND